MHKASPPAAPSGGRPTHSASANPNRRRFVFALGVTSAGAAAAPALATVAEQTAAVAAPTAASGYRETEHVRDYYDSARI